MRKLLLTIVILASSVLISWAQTPAQPAPNPKDYTAYVVGYAHMDMAWLWRWEESIHDIMYNTFSNQLKKMDENPDYTFAQDQAVVLDPWSTSTPTFSRRFRKGPDRQLYPRYLGLGADG